MKSILIYSVYLSFLFCIFSCKSKKSIDDLNNELNSPFIYLEVVNSDNSKDTIEFFIDENLIDSLKISKSKLLSICKYGSSYGDWNVKFKPTYKYEKSGYVSYNKENNEITVSIKGTCENGYGVRDNIHNIISFDRRGIMMHDKNGVPKIETF